GEHNRTCRNQPCQAKCEYSRCQVHDLSSVRIASHSLQLSIQANPNHGRYNRHFCGILPAKLLRQSTGYSGAACFEASSAESMGLPASNGGVSAISATSGISKTRLPSSFSESAGSQPATRATRIANPPSNREALSMLIPIDRSNTAYNRRFVDMQ